MSLTQIPLSRRLTTLLALLFGAAAVQPGFAAEPAAPPSVTVTLINRLVERGVLSEADSADLLLVAEADAAEARAQAAMTQAALAQAAAAQARLKAVLAQTGNRRTAAVTASAAAAASEPEETAEAAPTPPARVVRPRPPARVARVAAAPKPPVEPAPVEETPAEEPAPVITHVAPPATRVARANAQPRKAVVASVEPTSPESAPAESVDADEKVPDDTVRVTYVPEVVKAQLREEIKNEVMDQAREENWASPHAFPDWISKFRLFGDLRVRYESFTFPKGNDNTGAFPNFNAINTGAPFDVSGSVFSPQLNVDQSRSRIRLRSRLGAAVDMGQNFTAGLRLATGENNSPVSQNQSLGAAGSGQGGNFSKYVVWLDRAFLRYETGGLPDQDFSASLGRFDNPFFATSMIWADDLGFDGAVVQGRYGLGEDVTPFFALGAFPVFNTDLNFASNQPAKFKSNDKWLYGGQVGVTWELGKDVSLKLGTAYYLFQNIEGKRSTPFTPLTASDSGDTDSSRPAFAQKGNTYMALRDIVSGPLNGNGTTNQFQYFGLASQFAVMAADARLDFNQFEPFQISLIGEFAKNNRFDSTTIAAKAVNNLGAVPTGATAAPFLGSDTAWLVGVTLGDVALKERWKWNVSFGYRKVGSDALVDGFVDSDFGGGGTNVKGFTFGANVALSPGVRIGLRWMSASEVAGPTFKNDILQIDFNGKF